MNKKLLTIGSSSIVAVLLVLAVASFDSSVQTQEFVLSEPIMPEPVMNTISESPMTPPPRSILKLISHPIEYIGQADAMLSFSVQESLIPKGYSVQGMSSNPEGNTFLMLLSEKEITEKTTKKEFYADGGILIFIEDHSDGNIDTKNWATNWLDRNDGQAVSINGKDGIERSISVKSFEDGSELTQPAKVVFYDGNVLYKVQSIANTPDLIKIAESLR